MKKKIEHHFRHVEQRMKNVLKIYSSLHNAHLWPSDESYLTPNKLSKSVDGTISDITTMSEMKETISQLTDDPNSTQKELENTKLQNNDLHKQITKFTAEIKLRKSLCSSLIENTNSSIKKKRHSLLPRNLATTPSLLRYIRHQKPTVITTSKYWSYNRKLQP